MPHQGNKDTEAITRCPPSQKENDPWTYTVKGRSHLWKGHLVSTEVIVKLVMEGKLLVSQVLLVCPPLPYLDCHFLSPCFLSMTLRSYSVCGYHQNHSM